MRGEEKEEHRDGRETERDKNNIGIGFSFHTVAIQLTGGWYLTAARERETISPAPPPPDRSVATCFTVAFPTANKPNHKLYNGSRLLKLVICIHGNPIARGSRKQRIRGSQGDGW